MLVLLLDIAAIAIVFLGGFIQSAIGFGLAVVAAPLLFFISPDYVPAPIIIVGLFLSIINAYQYRQSISLTGLWAALIGRLPGSVAGAALLYYADAKQLSLLIGALVIFAVLVSLAPWKIQPTKGRMLLAGFFSGLFGTSSSIGGPPIALMLQHQEANLVRANLAAFFLVSCVMSLMMQAPIGYLGMRQLELALPLLPSAFVGFLLARHFAQRIPKQQIRLLSLLICFIAGLTAVYNGL